MQVRRTTDLENIYHVVTDQNLADLPTRPEKVIASDVDPLSSWHTGLDWMKMDLDKVVEDGIITPLVKLSMSDELKEDFEQGFVYEKTKDVLTKGHIVTKIVCGVTYNKERVDLVYSRAAFAKYLVLPTKYHFPAVVRILGLVWKFLKSFKCSQGKFKTQPKFKMFTADTKTCSRVSLTSLFSRLADDSDIARVENSDISSVEDSDTSRVLVSNQESSKSSAASKKKMVIIPSDEDMSDALSYLFQVATKEVKEFVKPEILRKIAVESQGVLYSKSRIMEGQRFILSGDLKDTGILADQGVIIHTPVIDRFSPLAYSIGLWVHDTLSKHAGYETSNRTSLGFCFIMKGASLYEEIGQACTTCKKLRKKFLEVSMGPISSHRFAVCPPFWVTQADLFGPVIHYVPGRERNTRMRPALECKCYVFVMVCMVTKLINMQVVESKDVGGICCALTRLGCEVGMPKLFLIDQDSGIMATMRDAED